MSETTTYPETSRPSSQSKSSGQSQSAGVASRYSQPSPETPPDMVTYLKDYARAKPDVAALWCFGVGFVLGWKLKPW
ncbi:hypothetical protein Mal64_14950 [Pseudobythopirellula maris]|uniref:Uncharacterized protein n=1 Tax=Pseudobythopirellula maris TaxID=2527991 RepID=A0A5C5ZV84_9BACT|nr:hypothetical protein [Pseudobythopirellula maris]TWT91096.1 hypothetical protein Mal64_14950 [Pseudobythopirellula maris]